MNHYGKRTILAFLFVALGLSSRSAFSAIIIHKGGLWPQTWPRELEPLRKDAVTIDVATGRPEVIYEIRFRDRSTFERAWPLLCQLRSEGAPLRLYRVGSPLRKGWDQVLSNNLPTVRIRTPVTEPVREPESNKSVGAAAPSTTVPAVAEGPSVGVPTTVGVPSDPPPEQAPASIASAIVAKRSLIMIPLLSCPPSYSLLLRPRCQPEIYAGPIWNPPCPD